MRGYAVLRPRRHIATVQVIDSAFVLAPPSFISVLVGLPERDVVTDDQHLLNRPLSGLGLDNAVTATFVIIFSGGRTVVGAKEGEHLFSVIVLMGTPAKHIPLAVSFGTLIAAGWNLIE